MSRFLLLDDDPNTLASLARAFRLEGHDATVCDNADGLTPSAAAAFEKLATCATRANAATAGSCSGPPG